MLLYSEEERAALHWAEVVTEGKAISEQDYTSTLNTFGEQGIVTLTLAINVY